MSSHRKGFSVACLSLCFLNFYFSLHLLLDSRCSALTQEIKQNKDFMENIDYGPRG